MLAIKMQFDASHDALIGRFFQKKLAPQWAGSNVVEFDNNGLPRGAGT